MPLPTDPNAPRPSAQRPAQVLLNSPLAASSRMLGLRASRRPKPRLLWRRVVALACSLLIHILFLLGFTFVPDWEMPPGKDTPAKMQARFIELPDLAPPPPPKGELPRQVGPVHQGHAAGAVRAANRVVRRAPSAPAVAAKPVASATTPAKVTAAPTPPPSVPRPAPVPRLQPVPVANAAPQVSLSAPALRPPVPPAFQPKPVRAPQLEGNQPMLPPPSLALPTVQAPAQPTIAQPSVALDRMVPDTQTPAIVQPAHVDLSAAPPAPELQAVPLPAQVAPQVSLRMALNAPAPSVPLSLPKLQVPAPVQAQAPSLAVVPLSATVASRLAPAAKATVEIANDTSLTAIGQPLPVALPPADNLPTAAAATTANAPGDTTDVAAGKAGASAAADVSTAPDASPRGSDSARPGEPQGTGKGLETATVHGNGPATSHGVGSATRGEAGKGLGKVAGMQPGPASAVAPASGAEANKVPDFIQLKPTGDTAVMSHGINGVRYRPTRFDPYWTPPGESSLDTALRHAAEKTTLRHTFHLPRGIRIRCVVMPLVPVALLGCGGADPPPAPVAQKVYDHLNLPDLPGGSVPSMPPPAPAASAAVPARVVLDNAAQCAAARVAGGPLPPGCPPTEPVVKGYVPAASSSSWVPASDQFH